MGMTSLPAKKPHFLGKTWSSMWMPLTPMDSYSRTLRQTLMALP